MSKNSRRSIYKSAGNLHTEQNQSMPELGLVAVEWERDGSLQPPAAFFWDVGIFVAVFLIIFYSCLFIFNYSL